MGKKKRKAKSSKVAAELLSDSNIGKQSTETVREVFEKYLKPDMLGRSRRPQTIRSVARAVDRFTEWWSTISSDPLPVCIIRRKHLGLFRDWLAAGGRSQVVQNSNIQSVVQVLRSAVEHELITHAPKLPPLTVRKSAPKVYPSNEDLCAVWRACESAMWPRFDSSLARLPYTPCVGLRAALVIYRLYGLRTQELVRLEADFRSLTWANIHPPGLTPNPEGRTSWDHGWLVYTPQKQERVKWQPLYLPLHPCAAAALQSIRPAEVDPSNPIFDWAMSSQGFRLQWRALFNAAGVSPREGSGVPRYTIKHLRKAAYSELNSHRYGVAEHIIGHCADRSQTGSVVGNNHYFNAEEAVVECIRTMPVPECFNELLPTES